MSLRSFDSFSVASLKTRDEAGQDPALRGASLAFKKTPSPSKTEVTGSSTNGALAAAVKAGTGAAKATDSKQARSTLSPIDGPGPDSLKAGRDAFAKGASFMLQNIEHKASVPAKRRESPSLIAATRATARAIPSASLSRESTGSKQSSRVENDMVENDESSIPATNQLVELFEAKQRSKSPLRRSTKSASRIVSPTPIRPPIPFLSSQSPTMPITTPGANDYVAPFSNSTPGASKSAALRNLESVRSPELGQVKSPFQSTIVPGSYVTPSDFKTSKNKSSSQQKPSKPSSTPIKEHKIPPAVPPPRRSITQRDTFSSKLAKTSNTVEESDSDSTASFISAREALSRSSTVRKAKTLSVKATRSENEATSSRPFLPPPPPKPLSLQTSEPVVTVSSTSPYRPRRPSSTVSINRATAQLLKPHLTADSLANAMVASSLASSRAPSPLKSRPTPPPPRRLKKHHSFSFLTAPSPTLRAPSPLKSARQTLRSTSNHSSDEEKRGKYEQHQQQHHNMFKRKHPNKHNEGDRKRWRETITEVERKRYEGVWAANRGAAIKIEGTGDDEVHGLVVKDIWQRSGLSHVVLEAIWDLVVDYGQKGSERRVLRREEFVVGTWLIDQCLKGRRLPVEVGPSVWDSVKKLMSGIRTR